MCSSKDAAVGVKLLPLGVHIATSRNKRGKTITTTRQVTYLSTRDHTLFRTKRIVTMQYIGTCLLIPTYVKLPAYSLGNNFPAAFWCINFGRNLPHLRIRSL